MMPKRIDPPPCPRHRAKGGDRDRLLPRWREEEGFCKRPDRDTSHTSIAAAPLTRFSRRSYPLGRKRRDTAVTYGGSDAGTFPGRDEAPNSTLTASCSCGTGCTRLCIERGRDELHVPLRAFFTTQEHPRLVKRARVIRLIGCALYTTSGDTW